MTESVVIEFPRFRPGDRLTPADKIAVCRWEDDTRHPDLRRVAIHEAVPVEAALTDFVLIYWRDRAWARWGLARRGRDILVWQCSDGAELGLFPTMIAALAMLGRGEPVAAAGARVVRFASARSVSG